MLQENKDLISKTAANSSIQFDLINNFYLSYIRITSTKLY